VAIQGYLRVFQGQSFFLILGVKLKKVKNYFMMNANTFSGIVSDD